MYIIDGVKKCNASEEKWEERGGYEIDMRLKEQEKSGGFILKLSPPL